jgi:hypothetical protein
MVLEHNTAMVQVDGQGRSFIELSVDGEVWSIGKTLRSDNGSQATLVEALAGTHLRVRGEHVTSVLVISSNTGGGASKAAEEERQAAEEARNNAETARNANETSRVAAEGKRVVAESNRASNESTRVSNENQRIANENERKAAEEERQAAYQSKLGKEDIVQTTGSSTEKVMSQKAVTDALKNAGGGGGSSVTIVNNLTEGGTDKALSAEMGKTLSERIEEVAENGGGVPIVDSVDKLDPNAPQGSLATVAVNTIGEVPFSELYQPTSDEVNMSAGIVDTTNLSSVSGITINSSFDTSAEIQPFMVYLFSKDFNMQGGVGQVVGLVPFTAVTMDVPTEEENEFELFTPNEDGTIIVNEENLAIINNLLSSTEFVYGGVKSMDNDEFIDPSYAEIFYKGIGGEQKTELYIKDIEEWRVVGDEELKAKVDDLQTIVDNLEDKTDLIVNSVDELPQDAPIGTLASVIYPYEKQINIPISSVQVNSRIPNGIHIILPNSFIKPDGINNPLTVLTYQRSVGNRAPSLGIEFTEDGATIYWNGGGTAEPNHTIAVYDMVSNDFSEFYQSELNNLNNGLLYPDMGGTYATVKSIVSSENAQYVDQFITTLGVGIEYNSVIYIKNSSGWEQYSELVDGSVTKTKLSSELQYFIDNSGISIYNSIEELPTEDEVGSIAKIIKDISSITPLSSLKYPQYSDPNGGVVSSIHPVKLLPTEIIAQQTNTQIQFMSRSGSNGSYSTFTIKVVSSDLEWSLQQNSTTKSGKLVYWEDDKYVVNSADFDFINTELGSHSYNVISPLAPGRDSFVDIDKFLEVSSVAKCVFLYVKNETGWEEYDKATKDKVTTLESKVAELEAKIQELLQN